MKTAKTSSSSRWLIAGALAAAQILDRSAVGAAASVTLDAVRLGQDFTANFHSLFPAIVFDAGVFQMWVFDGSGF